MVNFVTKKDGQQVPFDPEKLKASIMAACQDAGLPEQEKVDVTQKVSSAILMALEKKEEVSSTEIKNMILEQLDNFYMSVADAWRKYDASKVK